MNIQHFAANVAPPSLAIILQRWRFPSDRSLEASAFAIAQAAGDEDLTREILNASKIQLAMSGLAPSFISVTNGIFDLFMGGKDGAFFVYIFVIILITMLIIMISYIGSYPTRELVDAKFETPKGNIGWLLSVILRTPKSPEIAGPAQMDPLMTIGPFDLIGRGIYFINGMLIMLIVTFFLWDSRSQIAGVAGSAVAGVLGLFSAAAHLQPNCGR